MALLKTSQYNPRLWSGKMNFEAHIASRVPRVVVRMAWPEYHVGNRQGNEV